MLLYTARAKERNPDARFTRHDLRTAASTAQPISALALRYLVHRGLVAAGKQVYDLTEQGRDIAFDLLQKHRLWETYLSTIGLPEDHVHRPADEIEHFIDDNLKEKLLAQLQGSKHDPHGRKIPASPGSDQK